MIWTAIIPFKGTAEPKTRLRERLDADRRRALAERLLAHVAGVLEASAHVREIALLSDAAPLSWPHRRLADHGQGVNAELERIAGEGAQMPLMIVHADLPFLTAADIAALSDAGARGVAIAPDRHDMGTNALALADPRHFRFAFGPDSLARHRRAAGHAIVRRNGLSFDLDTPADLDAARALGFAG